MPLAKLLPDQSSGSIVDFFEAPVSVELNYNAKLWLAPKSDPLLEGRFDFYLPTETILRVKSSVRWWHEFKVVGRRNETFAYAAYQVSVGSERTIWKDCLQFVDGFEQRFHSR